ncbi:MAG: molybdopterin-dependent oxidoreductase [Spirochaetales bacterium]|nr:molybdopterin-dependent oxidoreductase [Spirochaetales bacterium]
MKKNLLRYLLPGLAAVLLLFAGCSTVANENSAAQNQPAVEKTGTDTITHATPKGEGWMIKISGVRSDEIWESNFVKWKKAPSSGYGEYEFSEKGKPVIFKAMPLKNIIAIADDADATMPYSFLSAKWKDGYDITMTASDGYSVTVNSEDFPEDAFYLADGRDGENISPMITGNISTQFWLREISDISLSLQPLALENNDFELLLDIGGKEDSFTISELEKLSYYIEDRGNYTNTYDNNFQFLWGGVKIVSLINEYAKLSEDMSVIIEAMDGYAMTYSAAQLMDDSDGEWILAFKEDGKYMPEDPGYIRLVKVGPENPTMLGHTSARMVKKIILENSSFKDFTLKIIDGAKVENMDRQTLQSGVTTWRTIVNHFNSKEDKTTAYMGMPIYEILGNYSGYDTVSIVAEDGYTMTLKAEDLQDNADVILAMFYGDGSELADNEFPLVVAWDKDAERIPSGIKPVRNVAQIIVE